MFLLIDNYDSFTFNLVQIFQEQGRHPVVMRNDDPRLLDAARDPALEMVCISPGPGRPEAAGLCHDFLRVLPAQVPLLGVCLGHQVLGHFFGAAIEVAGRTMHGKQSSITHAGQGLFAGLPPAMQVGRYHSLLVSAQALPETLEVTARTQQGEVMGIRVLDRPWAGVQFHPESILTPEGRQVLANFPHALLEPEKAATATAAAAGPLHVTVQIAEVIEQLAQGKDLEAEVAEEVFARLMSGELSPVQAGAFLMGLRVKGEAPQELGAAAGAVLEKAVQVPPMPVDAMDIVGTGGDGKGSFNCSSATALVLAGMGHKVLKHGNRSVSSRSGSADVLERLGIPIDTPSENVPAQLEKEGFVFLFAPQYHPSFRHIMPLRRDLGVRTLFNILGPLVNPARPSYRLLGAARQDIAELMAKTLAREGCKAGAVVYGAGGYDELTALGPATLIFVHGHTTRKARLDPAEYGFTPCREEELMVEGPEHSAVILRELLQGKGPQPMKDMLALNLGLALYLFEPEAECLDPVRGYDHGRMAGCMRKAREAVASGAGRRFAHA